ncbi:uncharacterized protein C16orf46 homolog [Eptesicus fuscus]|uniref:uncharacterized protein C16orf46 homolog n=1 Tax=Eptesicus fuscus TaxID=29078 RepID=UPI00046BDEC5|nr:uncharacterized protein C16orf46 homolog [Eptesicus fuscus]XP_027998652.1 uncharacterized protein C16orf46 homolog [Eptesicus fuscus]XP_027998653.1 uncharacterized protein C16orf46 homolog [Eptesicus fuscus]XP_027998654.1 uncharacterized protein C16orf46 homolog [Eptesicus fuscus]XP_027998655.1 uncharacterized protein C16orf46 homolog [Eptesicus fuscus]XP_054566572.1 uncharacterized protein C16orf46 homolog [Eptesicus fuscus]
MDLCQKKETELENSENNEIPSTEETELKCTYSDERREKNHVCCLLNISDITLEQDEKANKFVIETGWEEAVRGWGKTSPTACIWPRKKRKKAKVGESVRGCLLCVSLSQGIPETGPQTEARRLESRALAEPGSEQDRGGSSQTQSPTGCPTTASRNISKMCSPSHSQGDKKGLQIKEFLWCMEEWAVPETVRGQDSNSGTDQGPSISNSLNSKALLVLPPLNSSAPNGLDVQGKKSKSFLLQPEEKVLSVEKDECVACAYGLKIVEGKDGKRPFELAKHLKVNCMQPFPPPMVGTSLLANPELGCLHWSLLPKKNLRCPPNPNSVHCLSTVQLLQKQREQSYKARFKARELRPPMNTQKCILKEAKQENRPHPLETNVFPRPFLPSLKVSRVVIPVSTHRFL